jgi:hypothetical protein
MESNTSSVRSLSKTDPLKRVGRCEPSHSYYHLTKVVNSLTYQLNIMTSYATMAFVGFVATMAIVCHFGVQALDKATAKQCATHDWPQAAHQIHMDWCAANNYKTN